jgi:hypothetical protein
MRASHALSIVLAAGSLTGAGALIAGGYYATDLAFEYSTGRSLNERLDDWVGEPLWDF